MITGRTIRRKTMLELKAAIYEANGWKRETGESMSARVKTHYDVTADHKGGVFVATPKTDRKKCTQVQIGVDERKRGD